MAHQRRQRRKSPPNPHKIPRRRQSQRHHRALRILRNPLHNRARTRQQENLLENPLQHARQPLALLHPDLVRRLQAMVRQRPSLVLPRRDAQIGWHHGATRHYADHGHEPDVQLCVLVCVCVFAEPRWEAPVAAVEYGAYVACFFADYGDNGDVCGDEECRGFECDCCFYLFV